jgi:hypothetical protein
MCWVCYICIFTIQDSDDYNAIIEQLGGTLLDTEVFDDKCTHLVISKYISLDKYCLKIDKYRIPKEINTQD